jgi:hypothetical protein
MGLESTGVATVLSTTTRTSAAWATLATAARSAISHIGFAGVSTQISRVRPGRIARSTASRSHESMGYAELACCANKRAVPGDCFQQPDAPIGQRDEPVLSFKPDLQPWLHSTGSVDCPERLTLNSRSGRLAPTIACGAHLFADQQLTRRFRSSGAPRLSRVRAS